MPPRRHMRTITTVLAAMSAVLALTLSTTGSAQAAGGAPNARSASGHAASTSKATQSKPDGKVDQTQKSEQAHYTNAPCNRAEKDYLARHLARCLKIGRASCRERV